MKYMNLVTYSLIMCCALVSMSAFVLAEGMSLGVDTSVSVGAGDTGTSVDASASASARTENRSAQRTEIQERMDARIGALRIRFAEKIRTPEGRAEVRLAFREQLRARQELHFADRNVTVRALSDERKEIIAGKINARTGLNLTADDINGSLGSVLRAELSNGRFAEVKVMPHHAAAIALHRMRAKCEERNCSVELKEVGTGNKSRLAYVVETEQDGTFLFFKRNVVVSAEVDAETGAIISTHKPWWAVFVNEQEATEAEIEAATEVTAADAVATEARLAAEVDATTTVQA